ncbi:YbjN domain-containing protein [Neisseriaceae bacterium TC5R-5]|nr:YbjN domain-containing protein [Neisseriaceae bacterium TC5R-5]
MTQQQETSTPALLFSANAEQVAEAIKAAGCTVNTVENNGVVSLQSASQGVAFQVLWGNAAPEAGHYLDFTLNCPLRVEGGSIPEGLIAEWHRSKRFVRIAEHPGVISLEMDVLLLGGVTQEHMNMMVQLWTQMLGQVFLHLRNFAAQSAGAAADSEPVEIPVLKESLA